MQNIFDDASKATEEMFTGDSQMSLEDAEQLAETNKPVAEAPTGTAEETEQPTQEETVLNDAVNTVAQEKDTQLQEALQAIDVLQQQNQQMQGAIEELSNKNEENLIEEALQMPTLDINGLAFADDETIAKSQEAYAQQMAEFVRNGVMKELEPFLAQAKEGQYQREKADTLSILSQVPELQGISEILPQLDRIIANNKWLQSEDMPLDEKYVNAYAIARGVNAINTPPEPPKKELTSEELMQLYDNNPTFQELVEKKRLEAIKNSNSQQVPPFSASSGAVNAALNIKEKPKSFEEASERTRRMFGLDY